MKRTHTCGELNISNLNENIILQGWVSKIRKMGAMTFIDLRDLWGITQLVIEEKDLIDISNIKPEFVIEISGVVIERKSKNFDIPTGEIEIKVSKINIINKSDLPPFEIKNNIEAQEDTRLKYRYLDLRRPEMQEKFIIRHKVYQVLRNFFSDNKFIEIETPIFGKSTPEGARDFLIPSRLNKNKFYALPQSPQLYKQLFMISGFDRYFQIAKCFRDEDLRIDRQLEFTQLDMEMSFANQEDVIEMIENSIKTVMKTIKNLDFKDKFIRLDYSDAIEKYGTDKPDLRFDLEIKTLNDCFKNTDVNLFKDLKNKSIRSICVSGLLNKKELESLTEVGKQNSVEILGFAKYDLKEWTGSIGSKLNESEKKQIIEIFNIKNESTVLFVIEDYDVASKAMGAIRNACANLKNLINREEYKFLWVINFPLFEFSEEENRYVAAHHPFTMPSDESIDNFDIDFKNAKAKAYDIVLNGFELGGGSQRITNKEIQERMFKAIGFDNEKIKSNFGWFVNAYNYGAPYHSGCAIGLDRLCMLLTNSSSIREVIAFPKNSSGIDPMTNAPDIVESSSLDELNIKLK
ncbi:aspartyl-tRNA synthetase [Spiroplasma litorale]|uniref:Aspartate--tRNA ligase n=1 Tax=Spiroplasma litorale TaxID=216942 RepID=A0A0K1W1Q8_9MOLU|nr:aspartate--tRNA ligase [Spiroplasma litorale]AKX34032.1 aspartyl-tRNA synthetase [Spiroplasma litorale]